MTAGTQRATRAADGDHENVLKQEPPAIEQRAESIGSGRLDRSDLGILVTAIVGGGEVSIGALTSMTVLGATVDAFPTVGLSTGLAIAGLVFPVGFLFVIMGRSELFTAH